VFTLYSQAGMVNFKIPFNTIVWQVHKDLHKKNNSMPFKDEQDKYLLAWYKINAFRK